MKIQLFPLVRKFFGRGTGKPFSQKRFPRNLSNLLLNNRHSRGQNDGGKTHATRKGTVIDHGQTCGKGKRRKRNTSIKESNRTLALITELKKLGYLLEVEDESRLCWFGKKQAPEPQPSIQTYQDHRIAMAFSVASLKFTNIHIEDKEVVTKSYPRFWEELQNVIK